MIKKIVDILFALLDLLFISFVFYFLFYKNNTPDSNSFYLVLTTIMITLFYEKIYTLRYDFWEETKSILKALLFSAIVVLLTQTFAEKNEIFPFSFFLVLAIALPTFKRVVKKIVFHTPYLRKRVKVIGNKEQAYILSKELKDNWYLGLKVVKNNPKAIFIASKNLKKAQLNKYIKIYSSHVQNIYIVPYLENINFSQAQIIELFNIKTSLIKIENNLLKTENIVIKEIFEKVTVLCLLPFLILLHGVISILIKKDSKGSIFFKQQRLGKNNKTFICYKYRTMLDDDDILKNYLKNNPEEIEIYDKYHKYTNDPRVTKIGNILRKTSLDEIPQLFNILKGDMNLIGPRPYMKEEYIKLKDSANLILRVKPGLSGLWQVSGRNELSFEDRKSLDRWYIQNWSLWMDIVIVIKTIKVVLLKVGAK